MRKGRAIYKSIRWRRARRARGPKGKGNVQVARPIAGVGPRDGSREQSEGQEGVFEGPFETRER